MYHINIYIMYEKYVYIYSYVYIYIYICIISYMHG